jgi:hypothetical protein
MLKHRPGDLGQKTLFGASRHLRFNAECGHWLNMLETNHGLIAETGACAGRNNRCANSMAATRARYSGLCFSLNLIPILMLLVPVAAGSSRAAPKGQQHFPSRESTVQSSLLLPPAPPLRRTGKFLA